jgi:hypothetical protein
MNQGKFCLIHDVWTTKGNRYAFIGATANYIDDDWNYKSTHLTLKLVAWRHFGALLARPVGRFLIRHGLHDKISVFHLIPPTFLPLYLHSNSPFLIVPFFYLHVSPDYGQWRQQRTYGSRTSRHVLEC